MCMCLMWGCQNKWGKTDRTARKNRWICYYSWRRQHPSISNWQTSRQKISEVTVEQSSAINQLNLIDIYKTFHPTTGKYTLFSSSHGIVNKIDHLLDYKTHFKKLLQREIILSNHNGIKQQNNRKIAGK